MRKRGVVLTFKPGTPRPDIEKALAALTAIVEVDCPIRIEEYDPKWGEPVWYVP